MIETSFQLPRLFGLGLLGLAFAGAACLAPAGLAEAATTGRIALVSRQYHARAATTGLGRPTTAHRWRSKGFPRYRAGGFQYQFHSEISDTNKTVSHLFSTRKWKQMLSPTTTSTQVQNSSSGDERHLMQLGLALALLYVVFLLFWFWGTREGRRRFEGAARS